MEPGHLSWIQVDEDQILNPENKMTVPPCNDFVIIEQNLCQPEGCDSGDGWWG